MAGMFGGPTGSAPGTGSAPAPAAGPAPTTGGIPGPAPQPGTAPVIDPAGGQPTGGTRPDGDVIRSALASQEQTLRQKWEGEVADLRQLETILRENGRDPRAIISEYQRAQQQLVAAQRAEQMGLGQVNPQFMQYIQSLQNTVEQLQMSDARREGFRVLGEAESANAEIAKRFGINYDGIKNDVRQYALQHEISVDVAFKNLYFDRFVATAQQQAQGDTILAMQGRGQQSQPASSAIPGSPQIGPVDFTKLSQADFLAAQKRMREGSY